MARIIKRILAFVLCFLPLAVGAAVPAVMHMQGTVLPGQSGLTIAPSDVVLMVDYDDPFTGVGTGTVDANNTYFINVTKDSDFNGTRLTLVYRKNKSTYQLTYEGKKLDFEFFGGVTPVVFPLDIEIGEFLFTTETNPSANGGDNADEDPNIYDVNGDGFFDEADIQAIKMAIARGGASAKYDFNRDGRVTTKDAILAIRRFTDQRFVALSR